MTVLLYGSTFFAFALIVHLILWRLILPERQTKTLLIIFFGIIAIGSLYLRRYYMLIPGLGFSRPATAVEVFQLWQYYVSLTLAYIITYSAIEADSPSLLIIMKIQEAGESGLPREVLEHELDDSVLIEPRVRDLVINNMAEICGGKYQLKIKGLLMARLFLYYRNLMRAGKGG